MTGSIQKKIEETPNLFLDTFFIRFIAIVLITNSHLERLYPIPQLGTGGAIGNSLFFMMSGYGLYLSFRKRELPFLKWYKRRITRLYPSVVLAVVAIHFLYWNGWSYWGWRDYLTVFIWPTPYWFIKLLMIFYIIFFIILKQGRPLLFLFGMAILTCGL